MQHRNYVDFDRPVLGQIKLDLSQNSLVCPQDPGDSSLSLSSAVSQVKAVSNADLWLFQSAYLVLLGCLTFMLVRKYYAQIKTLDKILG